MVHVLYNEMYYTMKCTIQWNVLYNEQWNFCIITSASIYTVHKVSVTHTYSVLYTCTCFDQLWDCVMILVVIISNTCISIIGDYELLWHLRFIACCTCYYGILNLLHAVHVYIHVHVQWTCTCIIVNLHLYVRVFIHVIWFFSIPLYFANFADWNPFRENCNL